MKGKKRLIGIITAIFGLSLVSLFSAHADTRTKANDTNYTISDVTNLQDFLLAKETPDLSEKNYDLNGDGIWDTFDRLFDETRIHQTDDRRRTEYTSCLFLCNR